MVVYNQIFVITFVCVFLCHFRFYQKYAARFDLFVCSFFSEVGIALNCIIALLRLCCQMLKSYRCIIIKKERKKMCKPSKQYYVFSQKQIFKRSHKLTPPYLTVTNQLQEQRTKTLVARSELVFEFRRCKPDRPGTTLSTRITSWGRGTWASRCCRRWAGPRGLVSAPGARASQPPLESKPQYAQWVVCLASLALDGPLAMN